MGEVVRVSGRTPDTGEFLKEAMLSQRFADVALCCPGGQRFLAHRLVLSAASPYLQEVLLAHNATTAHCEPITVILAEVEGPELAAILGLVYTGNATVPRSRLNAFLRAAETLHIRVPQLYPKKLAPSNKQEPLNDDDARHSRESSSYCSTEMAFPASARTTFKGILLDAEETITRTATSHRDSGGGGGGGLSAASTCEDDKRLPAEDLTCRESCCSRWNSTGTASAAAPSSSSIITRRLHVANRVTDSPWKQLARPHHSPRIQPIVLQQHQNSTTINPSDKLEVQPPYVPVHLQPYVAPTNNPCCSEVSPPPQLPEVASEALLATTHPTSGNNKSKKVELSLPVSRLCHSPPSSDQNVSELQFQQQQQHQQQLPIASSNQPNPDDNNNNEAELTRQSNSSTNAEASEDHHKCEQCGKTFVTRASLKVHWRTHSGEKPFRCADCGKQFSQLRNYKYHRSVHEGTREFAATCPECGKYFNDRGYLSSHMKIHRNRKEYGCAECGKSFNQRVAYNMHVRIHTGVKPHQCEQCGKAFSRKMLLKQHLRTHSGERPYQCQVCHKAFADRSNMTLHTRLHSGLKPYQCHLCSKAFTKKHHLKTHLNYHTGTKPYSCPNCSLRFSQSSNMRTHYKKCTLVNNSPGAQAIDSNGIMPVCPSSKSVNDAQQASTPLTPPNSDQEQQETIQIAR